MKIQPITKGEFNKIDGARRVIVGDYPQQFAILDLGEHLGSYGISWNSSAIIQPEVEISTDKRTLWIGVDRKLAAIDLEDGHIALSLSLHTNLFKIEPLESFTVALAELDLLVFNNGDRSICCREGLPEIAGDISVDGSDLVISTIDEGRLILNLKTLQVNEQNAVIS